MSSSDVFHSAAFGTFSGAGVMISPGMSGGTLSSFEVRASAPGAPGTSEGATPLRRHFGLGPAAGRFLPWLAPATVRLGELLQLPEDWDTYGSPGVSPDAANVALFVLREILEFRRVPLPQFVPTSEGGVQMEWHADHFDLEIEVAPNLQVQIYGCDERSGDEFSGDPWSAEQQLASALQRLVAQD